MPILLTFTLNIAGTFCVNVAGGVIETTKLGTNGATTGEVPDTGGAVLLGITVSPETGVVIAVNCGVVPIAATGGVTGTLKVVLLPLLIGPGFTHVTFCPVVEQFQPLLVNGADGGVIPAGTGIVVVIVPVAGPVPILATVTGILAVTPAVKGGIGPMAVVKSGTRTALQATGLVP